MPFVKGDPRINRAGKKPGTKDEKWKSAQAIWDMIMKEWDKLEPKDRAKLGMDVFRMHFERAIAQLPKNSGESVSNANKLMEEIKALEMRTLGNIRDGSHQISLDSRAIEIQAEPPSEGR